MKIIRKLASWPEHHGPDRFKNNNDGSYRAFEKYSHRITYKVTDHTIFILAFRHTHRSPRRH